MNWLRKITRKPRCDLAVLRVWLLARLMGIQVVVRYLRNPRQPEVTSRLLVAFGATIGSRSKIKGPLYLDNVTEDQNSRHDFGYLVIGSNCYIGNGVFLDLANEIRIDDNAVLSGNVAIITHADCNRSPELDAIFPRQCGPVHIGRGAWIGFGATILHDVQIGENSVVAASSLVRDHCEPWTLNAGTPAKQIRQLSANESTRLADPTAD